MQHDHKTAMAMVAASNKYVTEQNNHSKRMKQVKFPEEELFNVENLSIKDSENDQRPADIFSESEDDL